MLTFEQIFKKPPRKIQIDFAKQIEGPGLYILEAPTGLGKTEAALYAAYKLISNGSNSGIYFGLPTQLTSNKIHERVQEFIDEICLSPQDALLAHSMAWLSRHRFGGEKFTAGQSWFHPKKRSLLHPFGVGTVDQALMSIFRG